MKKISLRIADLRKRNRVTQQELADGIGVSFQTISKWETGVNMPDITILPLLADYFSVSTDQLLGLKPLDDETYIPEKTATKEFWNQKLEYLLRTRKGYWNDDYARFLISQVWKIDKPVSLLDCGCGYGFLGLLLLPHLPEGSTYAGIDFAKPGGYVVCIDANREFECCGLYIEGMDYQTLCRHEGLEKKWKTELTMQGRDYAIAIRTAHIMQKLGLIDVDVRMNDKVEFVTAQSADYAETKNNFITYNNWASGISKEEKDQLILHLLSHGLSHKEAEDYCNQYIEITDFFSDHPDAGYTFMKGHMISYGKKANTSA